MSAPSAVRFTDNPESAAESTTSPARCTSGSRSAGGASSQYSPRSSSSPLATNFTEVPARKNTLDPSGKRTSARAPSPALMVEPSSKGAPEVACRASPSACPALSTSTGPAASSRRAWMASARVGSGAVRRRKNAPTPSANTSRPSLRRTAREGLFSLMARFSTPEQHGSPS